jgi:hypothetical protein
MDREYKFHNYDVNIVQSYYNLKNLIDSGKKIHPRYSHFSYLENHLYVVKLVLERKGEDPENALNRRTPVILQSDDYSFHMFFCMELVTRPRITLPHFLTHQMKYFHKVNYLFLETMRNGVLTWLMNNDPFQDETLLEFINLWIDKQDLNERLVNHEHTSANSVSNKSLLEELAISTGFPASDKKLQDIANEIAQISIGLDSKEREDFLRLLCGTLNYQGFCHQQGVYKNKDTVNESHFRDSVIQHFTGLTYLGGSIVKEAEIAGGRVEISFRGITAELKVEKDTSDRDKLFEKYGKQPVVYASGNSKQFSLLCILDLTEKILPSAVPANSVKLITPTLHGFENRSPDIASKLVVVIIDGNTKNPSAY